MDTTTQTTEEADAIAIVQTWVADASTDGEADTYAGKRRCPRISWQVPVTIETRPAGIRQPCLYATSRDVSKGGLGVWCSHPINDGTRVRLSVADGSEYVDGCVRQCTETVGGYIVGIEFRVSSVPR